MKAGWYWAREKNYPNHEFEPFYAIEDGRILVKDEWGDEIFVKPYELGEEISRDVQTRSEYEVALLALHKVTYNPNMSKRCNLDRLLSLKETLDNYIFGLQRAIKEEENEQ